MSRLSFRRICFNAAKKGSRVLGGIGEKDAGQIRRADSAGTNRTAAGLSYEELRRRWNECSFSKRRRTCNRAGNKFSGRVEDCDEIWMSRLSQRQRENRRPGLSRSRCEIQN